MTLQMDAQGYPLKWHKFLIYFALWAGAIMNFISGAMLIAQAMEYGKYLGTGLYAGCVAYGVAEIALGVYVIYIRFQLAGFRQRAVTHLTICYALNFVLNIVDLGLAASLGAEMSSSSFSNIIAPIVFIVVHLNYYKKRAALFVN